MYTIPDRDRVRNDVQLTQWQIEKRALARRNKPFAALRARFAPRRRPVQTAEQRDTPRRTQTVPALSEQR